MAFRDDDIARVRDATDLVELVSEVTSVKRAGRSVKAICPFHQEKTPSLSIDAARGLYHCFGCGKGGDVFRFVQETQGLGFSDAVEVLARRAGVTLQRDPKASRRRDERHAATEAVAAAVEFYHRLLLKSPDAGKARAYLRGRGYDTDIVERFELGWSPEGWDGLVRHLREQGISEKAMTGGGLASRSRRGSLVDRFRGRIMFPIYDVRSDPVGFGARQLDGEGPKYLNSPETPLYHKGRLLYGLSWAKSEIVRAGYAVVVEGYTDVIALHQAGLPVAVATCGTALGEGHFDLLRRFTERVVMAFDADEAGAGASLRGFDLTVPGDLDLRIALLPEGLDPADLVQTGRLDDLRAAVKGSEPLLQFRLERELQRFDLSEPEARGRALRATAELVARHPEPLVRREYAAFLARRTASDPAVVAEAVEGEARRRHQRPVEAAPRPARPSGRDRAEEEMLRLLLANDRTAREAGLTDELFSRAEHRAAFRTITALLEGVAPGTAPDLGAALTEETPDARLLRELALVDRPLVGAEELHRRMRSWAAEDRIEALQREIAGLDPGSEAHTERSEELVALIAEKRELEQTP